MIGMVLGGYFVFNKDGYGNYRYTGKLSKKDEEMILVSATHLVSSDTPYIASSSVILIKVDTYAEQYDDD